MSLTKIVVVVDDKKEIFEGEIEARTNDGIYMGAVGTTIKEPILLIWNKKTEEQIAAFIKYDYWRYTD